MSASLDHATILKLNQSGSTVDTLNVIFNPKEYTWAKQNSWKPGGNTNTNVPEVEFGGGQPATLKMQLFFDTYAKGSDVREHTDAIYQLMLVDEGWVDKKNKKGRPPTVRFQWGKMIGFDAVVTNVSQRFTLFLPDGTPVRAVLDVTFQEIKDPQQIPKQNPTSGGEGGERIWTVKEGENLPLISFRVYHDPSQWRRIAEFNRLAQVRRLIPGTQLVIPNV
jgi:nucleoid-associated protein YgaU